MPDTANGSDYGPYAAAQAPQDMAGQNPGAAQAALQALQAQQGPQPATTSTAPAQAPQLPPENENQTLENLQKDSWGNKVYHGVLSALGGKYDTQFIPTPQGVIQQQVAQTPGQQWKRIISGAITGLGGAAAAGTQGPGGTMRGLGGGIQAGYGQRVAEDQNKEKQANTQFEQDQKAAMTNAQTSMLAQQKLSLQWEQTKQKMEASRQEIQGANEFEKVIGSGGSGTRLVGHAPDLQAAIKIAKADPSVHADHAGGYLQYNDHIDPETGKHEGVDAYYVAPTLLDSKLPIATTISVPVTKDGKATTEEHTIEANTLSYRDFFNLNNTMLSQKKDQALTEHAEQETAASKQKLPGEIAETEAKTSQYKAEAESKRGETAALYGTGGAGGAGGGAAPAGGPDSYITMIGNGQMDLKMLQRLVAKNPNLLNMVHQRYPDFDQAKVENYFKTVKEYGPGGSVGTRINNASTALVHLNDLMKLNTNMSHIPATNAHTAYESKAQQIAGEIAQFYKANNIPFEKGLEDQLRSTLPGNREAAATTMARSMGEKLDEFESQWGEAAPSAAYKPLMPKYSAQSMNARAALDPEYARRVQQQPPPAPVGVPAVVNLPGGGQKQFPNQAAADKFKAEVGIK